jgi:predicted transcriptional regulator
MDFDFIKNAKEKPDIEAVLTDKHPNAYNFTRTCLTKNSLTGQAYLFLKNNPEKAFTSTEISEALGISVPTTSLKNIAVKNFISKSKFQIPTGRTFNSVGYLYSYSEKAIWNRIIELIPKSVKQSLFMIMKNPNMIFSIKDLQDLTSLDYSDAHQWLDRIFIKELTKCYNKPLMQKKQIRGLRTFYYHSEMTPFIGSMFRASMIKKKFTTICY